MLAEKGRGKGVAALILAVFMLTGVGLIAPSISASSPREPVLGSKKLVGKYGQGFGRYKPRKIFNGGALSGYVKKIVWSGWGRSTARGHGRGFAYRPNGGYYNDTVIVRLRARKLGKCRSSNRSAYTQLRAQFQKKPGSHKYTRWFNWAGQRSICEWDF